MKNTNSKLAFTAAIAAALLFTLGCDKDCNGEKYSTKTHFCANNAIISKCGGKEYNPEAQLCDARDGKIYKYAKINNQAWMAENLNYAAEGSKCYGEGGQVYSGKDDNNNYVYIELKEKEIKVNCEKYGRLYNWVTAMKACPEGWHLPEKEEWDTLYSQADRETIGKSLKAKSGWDDYEGKSGNGDDAWGFSALPGGHYYNDNKLYNGIGNSGNWWSAALKDKYATFWYLYSSGGASFASTGLEAFHSVRCAQGSVENLCGDYDLLTKFCFGDKIYERCGGNKYNPETQFCRDFCGFYYGEPSCGNKAVFDKCDGKEFNPFTHICKGSKNIAKITHRCSGEGVPYDNATQGCCNINDGGSYVYSLKTQFCGGEIFGGYGRIYDKCEGKKYDYTRQSCENDKLQDYKCGEKKYNLARQFCNENKLYDRCFRQGDIDDEGEYDPKTEACCKYSNTKYSSTANEYTEVYNLETHICQKGLDGWVRDKKEIIKIASNTTFDNVIKLITEKEDAGLSNVLIETSVNGKAYSEEFEIFKKSSIQGDNRLNLIAIISNRGIEIYTQYGKNNDYSYDNLERLSEMLAEIFSNSSSKRDRDSIVISAENNIEFSKVIQIAQIAKAAGFTNIKLAKK